MSSVLGAAQLRDAGGLILHGIVAARKVVVFRGVDELIQPDPKEAPTDLFVPGGSGYKRR